MPAPASNKTVAIASVAARFRGLNRAVSAHSTAIAPIAPTAPSALRDSANHNPAPISAASASQSARLRPRSRIAMPSATHRSIAK